MSAQQVTQRRAKLLSTEPPMAEDQLKVLKQLAQNSFELDAFDPNLTREQIEWRIAALKAKLILLDEPPHTL